MAFDDDPPLEAFDFEAFRETELGKAATSLIETHGEKITQAAEQGVTPLTVIAPELEHMIIERLEWAKVERLVREYLGADFKPVGRERLQTRLPHKSIRYIRSV